MPPIQFAESAAEVIGRLVEMLEKMPRVEIVDSQANYVHAVFSSRVLGFKDDVEFHADESSHLLHYRSASRLGYYDFGVNRRRMKRLIGRLGFAAGH